MHTTSSFTPIHKSPHLNGLALIFGILTSGATLFYLWHQTKMLQLQIAKHAKEDKLLTLQIDKEERDKAAQQIETATKTSGFKS